MNRENCR